jgi:hypothetical protein
MDCKGKVIRDFYRKLLLSELEKLNITYAVDRYLNTVMIINQYLKSTQVLNLRNYGIRGGVKVSDPIWGSYMTYRYPNWAVKFFVDAIMFRTKLPRKEETHE